MAEIWETYQNFMKTSASTHSHSQGGQKWTRRIHIRAGVGVKSGQLCWLCDWWSGILDEGFRLVIRLSVVS